MRTVVHGVALLRLWTSVKLVSSLSHCQRGKKDFGLAATRSRTSTLWRPRKASTSSASAVGAGLKRLAGVTSGKAVGSQDLPRGDRPLCVSSSGPALSVPGGVATERGRLATLYRGKRAGGGSRALPRYAACVGDPLFCGCPAPELDDMIDRLPDELFKHPLEEVMGDSDFTPASLATSDFNWSTSVKILRCPKLRQSFSGFTHSLPFRTSDHPMRVFDLRVSAVTTKQALELPVAVNQDEDELTLEERFKNPQSADFTYEEETAGMNKETQSMLNFDVFEEVKMAELTPVQLQTVISTRWVKTRKSDGTCRCRIVARGYDQVVEDPDETYASTPSLLTLKTLLTLAAARGWLACDLGRRIRSGFARFDGRGGLGTSCG